MLIEDPHQLSLIGVTHQNIGSSFKLTLFFHNQITSASAQMKNVFLTSESFNPEMIKQISWFKLLRTLKFQENLFVLCMQLIDIWLKQLSRVPNKNSAE